MSQSSLRDRWRSVTAYFGVDSIALADEHRAREAALREEVAALREELEALERRVQEVERR